MRGVSDELQCLQRSASSGRSSAEVAAGSGGGDSLKTVEQSQEDGLTLPLLQDQVTQLGEKIQAHSDALEQVRKLLELQLQQEMERPQTAKACGSRSSLHGEVHVLRETIAAAEGAVHSLAPRLVEAVASVASGPRQAEMLAAAKSLHASQKGRLSRKEAPSMLTKLPGS